jgi:hypothetical protein
MILVRRKIKKKILRIKIINFLFYSEIQIRYNIFLLKNQLSDSGYKLLPI